MDINITLIYIFCGALNLILGFSTLFQNHKSSANRAFFFLTLSQTLWIGSLYFLYFFIDPYNASLSLLFLKAAYGFSLVLGMSIPIFFYYFPRKTFEISNLTKYLYIGISTLVILITTFTPLVYEEQIVENNMYIDDVFGPLYIIYSIYILLALGLTIILAIKKIVRFKGIDRKKTSIALVGLGLFGLTATIVNAILPAFEIYIFYKKTIIFSLFFLIPSFYSFHRYRFFNISYISLNILRKIILLSLFVLSLVIFNYFLTILLPNINNVVILIIDSTLALFIWLFLDKKFPKFTTGSFQRLKNILNKLKTSLYLCDKYENLRDKIESNFILDYNISSTNLYAVRKEKAKTHLPIYLKDNFTKELEKHKNKVIVLEEVEYQKISNKRKLILSNKMKDLEINLCIPLFSDHRLIGFFTLGHKTKNKSYSREEVTKIKELTSYLEVCLMNFLLKLNLQEENDMMKDIIEQKTEKLREQFEEIKLILEQQSDFISVTAHEFRTPLSIAMFQLEDTLGSHKHAPEVVKDMEVMGNSLNNLKDLTQKLFDVQQYDLNKVVLNKKNADIKEFLTQIFNDFTPLMKERKIKFEFKCNIQKKQKVNIDEGQLRQVLINLLNNAIKFADQNNPKIILGLKEKENNLQINIEDNGEGIPESYKEKVFNKFQTTKVTKGTGIGLGLYICRKIIDLHEGRIWVQKSDLNGANFIIEL